VSVAEVVAPPPREQLEIGFLQLERLEWGKFVARPNGPIEPNAEHGTLGQSRGFPAEIAAHCEPGLIGISNGEEPLPLGCPHGSILRPAVLHDGRVCSVFGRVLLLPENANAARGRSYTLARYLVVPDGQPVTPMAFLDAMNLLPLRGLTRREAEVLGPVHVAARHTPLSQGWSAFVTEATIFVMSGIPTVVHGQIAEGEFFEWMTSLWFILPPSLRPLFSAGWGVGNSIAGMVNVAHTPTGSEHCASFDLATRKWQPPKRLRRERADVSFSDTRLIAGRMFSLYGHSASNGGPVPLAPNDDVAAMSASRPRIVLQDLPTMSDAAMQRAMRRPGLRAWDHYRLQQFRNWLDSSAPPAPDEPNAFAQPYVFPVNDSRAVMEAIRALPGSGRLRAEAYVAALAESELQPHVRDTLDTSEDAAARARLIVAVGRHSTRDDCFDLLEAAIRAGHGGDLPAAVVTTLHEHFESRLDLRALELHLRLLREPGLDWHREWVAQNVHALVFAIAKWRPPEWDAALERLRGLFGDPSTGTFSNFVAGRSPTPHDATAIQSLPETPRQQLARQLAADWAGVSGNLAERREHAYQWSRLLEPEPNSHPLIRLAFHPELVTANDCDAIAQEIVRQAIPESLIVRASAFTLSHWAILGPRILGAPAPWPRVTQLWSPLVRRVLLDDEHADDGMSRATPQPVAEAEEELSIPADEVQTFIARWEPRFAWSSFPAQQVARFLWDLAARARVSVAPVNRAAELCRDVRNGRFTTATAPTDDDLRSVCVLGRTAAVQIPEHIQLSLWTSAALFWQMRLALEFHPEAAFVPTARQLEVLAQHRDWLLQHLNSGGPDNQRRNDFLLALADFQEYAFGDARPEWRAAYAESFLWGAFRAVPLEQQGSIQTALLHYGEAARDRMTMAGTFVRNLPARDQEEGRVRVVRDFVIPLLTEIVGRGGARNMLTLYLERQNPIAGFWPGARARIVRTTRWIRRQPRLEIRTELREPVSRVSSRIVTAQWFIDALNGLHLTPAIIDRAFAEGGAHA
jgi:hypothetical protein